MPTPAQPPKKLYSINAIGIGTFLGGPLAGGVMTRRNLLNLGRASQANQPLFLAIGLTIALFTALALAPSGIVEKMPGSLLPAIYIAAIVARVRHLMGAELDQHKNEGGVFYSGWKTFGVGMLSLIVTLVLVVSIFMFGPRSSNDKAYQAGWDQIVANETKAGEFSTLANKEDVTEQELVECLDKTVIPAWEDSDKVVTELEAIPWLDSSTREQRSALRGYVNLQRERARLLRQVLTTGDERAEKQLDEVQEKLDKVDLTAK